jgi:hypothetical protein
VVDLGLGDWSKCIGHLWRIAWSEAELNVVVIVPRLQV